MKISCLFYVILQFMSNIFHVVRYGQCHVIQIAMQITNQITSHHITVNHNNIARALTTGIWQLSAYSDDVRTTPIKGGNYCDESVKQCCKFVSQSWKGVTVHSVRLGMTRTVRTKNRKQLQIEGLEMRDWRAGSLRAKWTQRWFSGLEELRAKLEKKPRSIIVRGSNTPLFSMSYKVLEWPQVLSRN